MRPAAITLPLALAACDIVGRTVTPPPPGPSYGPVARVMVGSDQVDVRRVMRDRLDLPSCAPECDTVRARTADATQAGQAVARFCALADWPEPDLRDAASGEWVYVRAC